MRMLRGGSLLLILIFLFSCISGCGNAATLPTGTREPLPPLEEREPTTDGVDYSLLHKTAFAEAVTLDETVLTYEKNATGVTVTKYTGSETRIALPASLGGKPVTAIAERVFANRESLELVILPDSLETLGEGILAGCSSLKALRTPLLGANAKAEAYLAYLFGGDSYTANAMKVPATLEFLEIGGKMTSLPAYALFDCNDLGCLWFANGLTSIGDYALFGCTSLKYLPTGNLVTLGTYALSSCSSLLQMEFTEATRSLGFGALEGCRSLRRLVLPFVGGSATEHSYLGYVFGAEVPDFSKGYYPPHLQEVVILEGCTSLGSYAFYECSTLQWVTLPVTLQSIGVRAFAKCTSLVELTFPKSLTAIRENAFFGCARLQKVALESTSLTSLGINAFYDCVALTEVNLPTTLLSLPASCFAGCEGLRSLDLGGVTQVGKNAFYRCNALESIASHGAVSFEDGNDAAEKRN